MSEKKSSGTILPNTENQVICDETVELKSFCRAEELTKRETVKDECPAPLQSFLEEKNLMTEYNLFIEELCASKDAIKTKLLKTWWVNEEVIKIVSDFQSSFQSKGVKLIVCEKSQKGCRNKYIWIEYIDMALAGEDYSSPYDAMLLTEDSEEMSLWYQKIKFPEGVAIERLRTFRGARELNSKIPDKVKALIEEKDAFKEYNALIEDLCNVKKGTFRSWKSADVISVLDQHRIPFKLKGLKLFASHVEELQNNGNTTYVRHYRWIEFVDSKKLPEYTPARGNVEEGKEKADCIIS